ncbi:uncharacterized protein VP01_388g7 [Puccinia sorghi]|uniref:HAT C-terminal dimerisation domain-containing protein n=1 Tax=Puccinia sorghi TaxID=27349 RepID=A0A0L6USX3_9BASI|nr:uncharacterized protein VP01_388g7 [Puccinia sorghi]
MPCQLTAPKASPTPNLSTNLLVAPNIRGFPSSREPLNDVTHFLCESDYPALNIPLPMYLSLIKDLISILSQYNSEQLLTPSDRVVLKLKKYLMAYFHKNYKRLNTKLDLNLYPESVLTMFCEILLDIFGGQHKQKTLENKIEQYLAETLQDEDIDILQYWSGRLVIYPSLVSMARACLLILATRAPTEPVFSKSKAIIGPQRVSLDAHSIKKLLCVNEW